jgi:hypothetical protein
MSPSSMPASRAAAMAVRAAARSDVLKTHRVFMGALSVFWPAIGRAGERVGSGVPRGRSPAMSDFCRSGVTGM